MNRLRRYWPRQRWARIVLPALIAALVVFAFMATPDGVARVATVGSALSALVLQMVLDRVIARRRELDALRRQAAVHVMGPVLDLPSRPSRVSLLNPMYEVAHFEGHGADEGMLNGFLEKPAPALMVLSGPPWSGKTRLVAHWAAGVEAPWSVGWVVPGHGRQAMETGLATGDPTVLLVDGFSPDAGQVMDALGGTDCAVRMVLVVDKHVDVADLAKRHSTMAGHVAQSAKTWRVAPLGKS